MNQIIAEIGQNPFRVRESFHADRIFAALHQAAGRSLRLMAWICLGLLPLQITKKSAKEVTSRRSKHANVEGFFGFGGSNCDEPRRGGERRGRRVARLCCVAVE